MIRVTEMRIYHRMRALILRHAHRTDGLTVAAAVVVTVRIGRCKVQEVSSVGVARIDRAQPIVAARARVIERPKTTVASGGQEDGVPVGSSD